MNNLKWQSASEGDKWNSRESVDQASDKGRYAKVTHIEELPPRKGHSKQGEDLCGADPAHG